MDNKKKKIIWGIIIILVVGGLIWLAIYLSKDVNQPGNEDPYSIDGQPVFKVESPKLELQAPPQEASTEFTVTNLAKTFVARFGSWSTDNQGKNLQQLMSLSTEGMQKYMREIEINYQNADFYGVSTKSMSATVNELDEVGGQAEIVVHTQRVETAQSLAEKIYYQDVIVNLLLDGEEWLVDQVRWQ